MLGGKGGGVDAFVQTTTKQNRLCVAQHALSIKGQRISRLMPHGYAQGALTTHDRT